MDEKDKNAFLEDYKKSETTKKLDMWFFALEQEALWEEILTEMSNIAQSGKPGQIKTVKE